MFFDEISRLVGEAERQYGLANRGYTEYVTERLEPLAPIYCAAMFKVFLDWRTIVLRRSLIIVGIYSQWNFEEVAEVRKCH